MLKSNIYLQVSINKIALSKQNAQQYAYLENAKFYHSVLSWNAHTHGRHILLFHMMCVSEDSDQPAHPCSLIRIFASHIKKKHGLELCNERPAKTDQPVRM